MVEEEEEEEEEEEAVVVVVEVLEEEEAVVDEVVASHLARVAVEVEELPVVAPRRQYLNLPSLPSTAPLMKSAKVE